MPNSLIYHLARAADWAEAETLGAYRGSRDDHRDGFLHFSTASQVRRSAARHRSGESGLMLLGVDPARLGDALRWEAAASGELFPHLYAELPLDQILERAPLPLDSNGLHVFPSTIPNIRLDEGAAGP